MEIKEMRASEEQSILACLTFNIIAPECRMIEPRPCCLCLAPAEPPASRAAATPADESSGAWRGCACYPHHRRRHSPASLADSSPLQKAMALSVELRRISGPRMRRE